MACNYSNFKHKNYLQRLFGLHQRGIYRPYLVLLEALEVLEVLEVQEALEEPEACKYSDFKHKNYRQKTLGLHQRGI